jgi:hypothetical protein
LASLVAMMNDVFRRHGPKPADQSRRNSPPWTRRARAPCGNRKAGLVRAHEPEEPGGTALVSRANQAAAFERISRSRRSCLLCCGLHRNKPQVRQRRSISPNVAAYDEGQRIPMHRPRALEDTLRQIKPNGANLDGGRLLSCGVTSDDHVRHAMPFSRGRPPHQSQRGRLARL